MVSAEEARDVRLYQVSIDMETSAREGGTGWSQHKPPELTASSSLSGKAKLEPPGLSHPTSASPY